MAPSIPFFVRGSFGTLFDLVGNGVFIAASIWITESFQLPPVNNGNRATADA